MLVILLTQKLCDFTLSFDSELCFSLSRACVHDSKVQDVKL